MPLVKAQRLHVVPPPLTVTCARDSASPKTYSNYFYHHPYALYNCK
jgi:hypothetical protein